MKEKTANEALRCLKFFVFSFGKANKLHTDNGLEVKNNLIEEFVLIIILNIYILSLILLDQMEMLKLLTNKLKD